MPRPVLILALLAAAYFAYTEFAPRSGLPTTGNSTGFTGSGNAPGKVVGSGARDAARGVSP